jgi:FkbM family methyltransferase
MIAKMHLRLRAYRKRWKAQKRGETELALLPLLVKGGVAVDIGANKGVYSYFLSRLCDRVIAYEANPDLAAQLRRYGLRGLEVRAKALSDVTGEAPFYIPLSKTGKRRNNVAGLDTPEGQVDEIKVQRARLDDESLIDISFIKIDVEGHELSVLRGAEKTILRERPILLVEINGGPKTDNAREIFALLTRWHYTPLQHFKGQLMHYSMLPSKSRRPRDRNYICLPSRPPE